MVDSRWVASVHVLEEGLEQATDRAIWDAARASDRAVVTKDWEL